jgi:adenylate kinase
VSGSGSPRLVVLAALPGVGKTTIARASAARMSAALTAILKAVSQR